MKQLVIVFLFVLHINFYAVDLQQIIFTGAWDLEDNFKLFGVEDISVGFIGDNLRSAPNLITITNNSSNYYSAIKITYDQDVILDQQILNQYFRSINPMDGEGSFLFQTKNFQPTIFYTTENQKKIASHMIALMEHSSYFDKKIPIQLKVYQDNFQISTESMDTVFDQTLLSNHIVEKENFLDDFWDRIPQSFLFSTNQITNQYIFYSKLLRDYFQYEYTKPSQESLQKRLSKISYKVTQDNATEEPFSHPYITNTQQGIYVDIVSGEPLFLSSDKIESSDGWLNFKKPIDQWFILEKNDYHFFFHRINLRSRYADSHLGFLLSDSKGNSLYQINGSALFFVPDTEMDQKGYSDYLPFI